MGSLEVNLTYFMTPKVNLTFDLDFDLKVKHLTWQVTTNVQQHFNVIRQLLRSILTELCSFIMFIFSYADKSIPLCYKVKWS